MNFQNEGYVKIFQQAFGEAYEVELKKFAKDTVRVDAAISEAMAQGKTREEAIVELFPNE